LYGQYGSKYKIPDGANGAITGLILGKRFNEEISRVRRTAPQRIPTSRLNFGAVRVLDGSTKWSIFSDLFVLNRIEANHTANTD
jgi:hypothetical protein